MKNLYAVAAFMLLTAGTASAGETGIINRAGPYEAQMQFYLHPALGFPGTPEPAASDRAVDSRKSSELTAARPAAASSTPAFRVSHPARNRAARVASAERG